MIRTDAKITLTEGAQKAIADMRRQCVSVAAAWGTHKPTEVIAMQTSLVNQLCTLFGTPFADESSISRDDELSLLVVSHITMGMIFFGTGRPDMPLEDDPKLFTDAPRMGRYCMGPVQAGWRGTVPCTKPIYRGEATCTGHSVDIMAAPVIGEWSLHS